MASTLKELDYKTNPDKYNLALLELQSENLRLSTKQLKRYWLLTCSSFILGIVATTITTRIGNQDKPKVEKLEYRITLLESTVNKMGDSIQNLLIYNTIRKDSLSK